MVVRRLVYFVFTQFFLCAGFLGKPVFAQRPTAEPPPFQPSPLNFSADLELYTQGPDHTPLEDTAAVTLFNLDGQVYRQGVTRKGHLRWNEIAPMQYQIQVLAPGFERAVHEVDARTTGEIKISVQLRPQTAADIAYPTTSSDPEVNYVFGEYASRLGDWEQAKSYWTKVLEILPDHVPAIVSMSEVLLNENKAPEAAEYLDRAAKIDPSYWRTQSVLAEMSLRAGATSHAVRQAERAMELGHEQAASASPLLARALMARAEEVLRSYLKDHPEDVAARKQLEGLGGSSSFNALTSSPKPASRTREAGWLPPDIDEGIPPVEPGTTCNLTEVLEKAGRRIQEFVGNVDRFTASESLLHEALNKSGKVLESARRKYDYVVSISEIRPGFFGVDEYESSGADPADSPGGFATKGLPALVLIFHPYYSGAFSMKCEGLATVHGQRAWQVYFRQRKDKPNHIRSYRIGWNASYPVDLKGRAWIVADSYQMLGLQTDLIDAIPDIRLTAEHTDIQYGPVHFASRGLDLWLPQTAEVYFELRGKRIHRLLNFTNYLLFAVDDQQQIGSPKANP